MQAVKIVEEIFVLALALNALLVAWFHEDSLLASWRARTELWEGRFGKLLNCRLCLSYQAPFWLIVLPFWLPSKLVESEMWSFLLMVPIYSLSVTTFTWIIAGLLKTMQSYFVFHETEEIPINDLGDKFKAEKPVGERRIFSLPEPSPASVGGGGTLAPVGAPPQPASIESDMEKSDLKLKEVLRQIKVFKDADVVDETSPVKRIDRVVETPAPQTPPTSGNHHVGNLIPAAASHPGSGSGVSGSGEPAVAGGS